MSLQRVDTIIESNYHAYKIEGGIYLEPEMILTKEYYYSGPLDEILDANTKIGVKITLTNGKQYGNIIEIPIAKLKELMSQSLMP